MTSKQPLTYTQVAQQLRSDLQSVVTRAWRGEEVSATLRVWQDGKVVTLVLTGQDLIRRMKKLENDLVWEDTRRTCVAQPVHLVHIVAAALAMV